jgi:hypothetical protein
LGGFVCRVGNVGCGRAPWWAQRVTPQQRYLVQYEFLGPGLVTEARYAEAVGLLWEWPEGRDLLSQASEQHEINVVTVVGFAPANVYAHYQPGDTSVRFGSAIADGPTWLVATVLVHELTHATDEEIQFSNFGGREHCLRVEARGYHAEAEFIRWVAGEYGQLPSDEEAAALLSPTSRRLLSDSRDLAAAEDLASFVASFIRNCAPV